MTNRTISLALYSVITVAVGFVAGYVFHAQYGAEHTAVTEAIIDNHTRENILDAYYPIVITDNFFKEVNGITSMEDVEKLKTKYRESTLRNIERFERFSEALKSEKQKALNQLFLDEAKKVKSRL